MIIRLTEENFFYHFLIAESSDFKFRIFIICLNKAMTIYVLISIHASI